MAGNNIVGVDLNIDKDYLSEAVRQTVLMGISEALNGKNEIVSQIVNQVLTTKVDGKGKISSYERDNKYTLLEFYVREMLTNETKACISEILDERRPEIHEIIKSELAKKKTTSEFVDSFFTTVEDSLRYRFDSSINVSFEKRSDD